MRVLSTILGCDSSAVVQLLHGIVIYINSMTCHRCRQGKLTWQSQYSIQRYHMTRKLATNMQRIPQPKTVMQRYDILLNAD